MFDLMPWRKREGKDLVGFKNELDNLFNRFFDLDFPISREFFKEGEWVPRVDVSEGKKEITVKAEIPGCNAKDIDVSLEGQILTIKGEKKQEKEEKEKNYYRMERSYGAFQRILSLPEDADQDSIKATFKNGVLNITLPRKALPAPDVRQIEIK